METIAFLGCSRGLGREVCQQFSQQGKMAKAILLSRTADDLNSLKSQLQCDSEVLVFDLAKANLLDQLVSDLSKLGIDRLFYFAGGGPYGSFSNKQWKDHQWALQVSFLTPAKILHSFMKVKQQSEPKQLIFVGSQIADATPDQNAASYAAAKHGLRGLVSTVQLEVSDSDIRLFRPGYMDTAMLPPSAHPRSSGRLLSPEQAALQFMDWALDSNGSKIFDAQV